MLWMCSSSNRRTKATAQLNWYNKGPMSGWPTKCSSESKSWKWCHLFFLCCKGKLGFSLSKFVTFLLLLKYMMKISDLDDTNALPYSYRGQKSYNQGGVHRNGFSLQTLGENPLPLLCCLLGVAAHISSAVAHPWAFPQCLLIRISASTVTWASCLDAPSQGPRGLWQHQARLDDTLKLMCLT